MVFVTYTGMFASLSPLPLFAMQLRPNAPAFEPASPSRPKEARPASGAPEGDAERPAKRPRTSDVSTVYFPNCSSFLPSSEFLTSSRCQRGMQTPAASLLWEHACRKQSNAAFGSFSYCISMEFVRLALLLLCRHQTWRMAQGAATAAGTAAGDAPRRLWMPAQQQVRNAPVQNLTCLSSELRRVVVSAIGLTEINDIHAGFCWQSNGCIPDAMSAVALGSSAEAGSSRH